MRLLKAKLPQSVILETKFPLFNPAYCGGMRKALMMMIADNDVGDDDQQRSKRSAPSGFFFKHCNRTKKKEAEAKDEGG